MTSQLTDRRTFDERRLVALQGEIDRARHELESLELHLATLEGSAFVARQRLEVSETPVADLASAAARAKATQMRSSVVAARHRLGVLEDARDDLLAKLVG